MRVRFYAAFGLMGSVLACGGRSLDKEIQQHPARVLPAEASQVVYARVDQLRGNPAAAWAYEKSRNLAWGQTFEGVARTLDLAGPITRLALGTYGAGDRAPATVVVATGAFDDKTFRAALTEARIPHVEGRHGNTGYYICGRGAERCYACFPTPRLVIAASQEDLLKQTLDLRRSGRKSLARDRALAPLLESFSPDLDLWGTGLIPAALLAQVARQLPPAIQTPVQYIQAFTVKLAGNETKRFNLILHCGSPEAAQANAELLKVLLGGVPVHLLQFGYRVPELAAALDRSQILVDGVTADFQIEFSRVELTAIVQALRAGPTEPPMFEPVLPGGQPDLPLGIPGEMQEPPAGQQPDGNSAPDVR